MNVHELCWRLYKWLCCSEMELDEVNRIITPIDSAEIFAFIQGILSYGLYEEYNALS